MPLARPIFVPGADDPPLPDPPRPIRSRNPPPTWGEHPDLDDPRWAQWAEPLLVFLAVPHTVPEVLAWARSRDIVSWTAKQLLAWLSVSGLAEYSDAMRVWQATGRYR